MFKVTLCLSSPNASMTLEDTAGNCSLPQPDLRPAPFHHCSYRFLIPQWSCSSASADFFLLPRHFLLIPFPCQVYLNTMCRNPEASVFMLVISSTLLKETQQNPAHRVALPPFPAFVYNPFTFWLFSPLHNTITLVTQHCRQCSGGFLLGGRIALSTSGFFFVCDLFVSNDNKTPLFKTF